MKKLLALTLAVALCGPAAFATDLNVAVQTDTGDPAVSVAAGATVNYQVVGVLSDTANEGLALFGFDLVFDGGDLPQADTPTSGNMTHFVVPDGITNPAGFGGTTTVPGQEGDLVQVGGAQNTINNDIGNAPYPIGTVVTGIGHTEVVLVTGSLTAPMMEGVYTLALQNLFANVIKEGESEAGTFWAVEEAGVGTIENLTITVGPGLCVIDSTMPPNCAIDARQPYLPDGTNPGGWDSIDITFTDTACASGASAGDFTVSVLPAGTPPTITDVVVVGATATLVLDGPIPVGSWTCFDYNGDQTCVGWLPADVNGDRTAAPPDILRVIDCLNAVATCEEWQCDADNSGVCGPPDILRVIDLLNGAGTYDSWLNVSLDACPSQ
jgi:hypothetical protein